MPESTIEISSRSCPDGPGIPEMAIEGSRQGEKEEVGNEQEDEEINKQVEGEKLEAEEGRDEIRRELMEID